MHRVRVLLPRLARHLSQPAASARAAPSPTFPGAALRRPGLVHRQSAQWRPSPASAAAFTASHETYSSAKSAAPAASSASPGARLLLSYHDLERALERRGLNTVRVLLFSAAATAVAVGLAWPRIKQWGAVEGAEVAAASLETEQLQERAAAMLHEVLADERTARQVEALLKDAVQSLFKDDQFTERAVEWSAKVLSDALTWDEVRRQGTDYVKSVFDDQESQKSAQVYLTGAIQNVVADEAVQDTVAQSLWSSVRVSLLGRRKPRNVPPPAPVEEPKNLPPIEQKQNAAQKEAVYASSTLDKNEERHAVVMPIAAEDAVSQDVKKDVGTGSKKGESR